MISPEMQAALNHQINEETYSAYLYASMANHFEHVNLKGFAHWMSVQAAEEVAHAQKIAAYLNERGAKVLLEAISAPPTEWDAPLAAFEAAYAHECHISACIDTLYSQAMSEGDHATHNFLEWFVTEQVEEESSADEVVQQLKLVAGAPGGLFMLDRELGQRPAASAAAEADA